RNTGQTCVCTNRFLVQTGIYNVFAARLNERIAALTWGDGLEGAFDQGPLVDARSAAKVETHVADAVAHGAHNATGGRTTGPENRFFMQSLPNHGSPDALLCREERFGPVAGLLRFDTADDAIRLANASPAGLAAYVFTRDLDRSIHVSGALSCGMVGLNPGLISTEVAPFGGCRASGFGREGSRYGTEEFLEMKTVVTGLKRPPVGEQALWLA